jgi:hypothetical protein
MVQGSTKQLVTNPAISEVRLQRLGHGATLVPHADVTPTVDTATQIRRGRPTWSALAALGRILKAPRPPASSGEPPLCTGAAPLSTAVGPALEDRGRRGTGDLAPMAGLARRLVRQPTSRRHSGVASRR